MTGLTGFKGQWLGKWLKSLGATVSGFGLAPLASPDGSVPTLADQFEVEHADVRDAQVVNAIFEKVKPHVVFHLAAQPLVRLSYEEPVETFATNVMGTVHVLDAARKCSSVSAIVNVTSDKCYENKEWYWAYREDEPMGGFDPYSASKGCSELVTSAFRRSYSNASHPVGIASGRAGNVIGGGDWSSDRLIPDIVRAVLADQPVVIRRPESIRPWQHVLEAVSGYLQLGAALLSKPSQYSGAWNFGPSESEAVTVRTLANAIVEHWQRGQVVEEPQPTGPHEAKFLRLDSSKAHAELGWSPLLTMKERIAWSVDWYNATSTKSMSHWDMMEQQITLYQERWEAWKAGKECSSRGSPDSLARPSRAA